uniref:Uncharacterized protein n=1 Tax=Anguilla anguilla TaxID=7936 RepID=A0A0E9XVL2_ANGAN
MISESCRNAMGRSTVSILGASQLWCSTVCRQ